MINIYRYGGHKTLHKDGKVQQVEVSPSDILEIKGPFLQVTITQPRIIQEALRKNGEKIPSLNVNALIDTGGKQHPTTQQPVTISRFPIFQLKTCN